MTSEERDQLWQVLRRTFRTVCGNGWIRLKVCRATSRRDEELARRIISSLTTKTIPGGSVNQCHSTRVGYL
jgi:hypothetical protein